MTFARECISAHTWPSIHALLAPAIERGGDTGCGHELIDELLSDRAQLWVGRRHGLPYAAAVTTIHDDHTLNCQLLGGAGMVAWVDALIATVAHHARPLGITHFTETGRTGWARFLARKGWRDAGREGGKVTMELDLADVD
jgi:hypothetical protein